MKSSLPPWALADPSSSEAGKEPSFDSIEDLRAYRKRQAALAYRLFGLLNWGLLGDGHITTRDPELTDHFWLLRYGVAFNAATVDDLVLVRVVSRDFGGEFFDASLDVGLGDQLGGQGVAHVAFP